MISRDSGSNKRASIIKPKYSTANNSNTAVGATVLMPAAIISPSCARWPVNSRKNAGTTMIATKAVIHLRMTHSLNTPKVAKPRRANMSVLLSRG